MIDAISGWVGQHLILTGVGGTVAIFLLTKFLPNRWLAWSFYRIGWVITLIGIKKVGIKFWRRVRHWLEDTLRVVVNNLINGLAHVERLEVLSKKGVVRGIRWDKKRKESRLFLASEDVNETDVERLIDKTI